MNLTLEELEYERQIEFTTRLGNLCGTSDPTPRQRAIANAEADEHVRRLKAPPPGP